MKRPGSKTPTDDAALVRARAAALPLVEKLISIATAARPARNAKAQVDSAKVLLGIAGVSTEEFSRLKLLRELRGKISKEAYAEVVGALAEVASVPAAGAGTAGGGAGTDAA